MEEVNPLHPRTGLAFTSYKLRDMIRAIDYLEASSFKYSMISNPEGEIDIDELLEEAEDQFRINKEDELWHRARSDDDDDAAMLDMQIEIDKSNNMKRVLWLIILLARINAGKLAEPRCIPLDVYHPIRYRTQMRIQPAWVSGCTSRFKKRFGVRERFHPEMEASLVEEELG